MPRVALLNMLIGFAVVVLAAMGGVFNSFTMTEGFLKDPQLLGAWETVVKNSSHGHTNLFALLHVLFGLTLPYSALPMRIKKWQTAGLFAGTLAMGPGMYMRAMLGPSESMDPNGVIIGVFLFAALTALLAHVMGLGVKLLKRD